jgi:ubiquinone/menaquinone biosynthesis C-methylase UbiE
MLSEAKTSKPAIYDSIGIDYNQHRTAEPCFVRELVRLLRLPRGATVADIGAGTGNYSSAMAAQGYRILAIEPSERMRSQATPNPDVQWHAGTAEDVPLPDGSVDGVMCTLAMHHFKSIERMGAELRRICPSGPIVFLTIDPRLGEAFWFADYFPAIHARLLTSFPPIERVCAELAKASARMPEISPCALPGDAVDITMHSGWNRPEIYLDPGYRQNMSGFALSSNDDIAPGLAALHEDLESGAWDRQHAHLRQRQEADLGFRFIKLQ